jgi:hypothetical protein
MKDNAEMYNDKHKAFVQSLGPTFGPLAKLFEGATGKILGLNFC